MCDLHNKATSMVEVAGLSVGKNRPSGFWSYSLILARARSEPCSYGGKTGSQGESKAAICNPELVETSLGMERMRQHSRGTLLPAIHVLTGQECLGMDPHFGSGYMSV